MYLDLQHYILGILSHYGMPVLCLGVRACRTGQFEYWSENHTHTRKHTPARRPAPPALVARTVFRNVQNTEAWNVFRERSEQGVSAVPVILGGHRSSKVELTDYK